MTEPKQPLYIEVNGKIVLPDPLRPGHFVNATPEAAAAIAALEAEVARLRGELHRLPDIVHAIPTQYEDFDGTMRDTTAEWVHGMAYNTVYERVRAAITPR